MEIIKLAFKSLYNRRTTALLTVFAIAVSVSLLLGVERVRTQAKDNFENTISGTDLIIGARTGPVQLLLYSVFRIGNATNNISWQSYQNIASQNVVKWSVPLSLGDSHRGYRVLGTTSEYFQYYKFGQSQPLAFKYGSPFESLLDAVIGAEVAEKLGYQLGDKIIVAHGAGSTSFTKHDQMPFTIKGILARTSTPVDSTVHVSLSAIEAIHLGGGSAATIQGESLQPKVITAALLGLKSKISVFQLQRFINQYKQEPLQAIIPGVALHELWAMMGVAEQALIVISGFVVASGLLGMLTMILASLNERRREMAILRAVGARPLQIFFLMISEAGILALAGAVLGVIFLFSLLLLAQPLVQAKFGILITVTALTPYEWQLLGAVIGSGLIIGVVPSWRAYQMSLADGMTIRV